ncbi:MAG: hypothetical protein ACOCTR_00455 [Candidatus Natronoplasma sp.]
MKRLIVFFEKEELMMNFVVLALPRMVGATPSAVFVEGAVEAYSL